MAKHDCIFYSLSERGVWPNKLTKFEYAFPAINVPLPKWQVIASPVWKEHHRHAVGEHLCNRVNEILCLGRNLFFQAANACLKQNGWDPWIRKRLVKNFTNFVGKWKIC